MRLFLGVDGGQSSTTALIGDETGLVLGAGTGGPCNHATAAEGRSRLENALRESVGAACAQAGVEFAEIRFQAACLGMSGGPQEKQAIAAMLLQAGKLVVTTDAEIALSGATDTGQGIIVIAGTGSIALGRNAAGEKARAGGWGYIFGDEGSAFDIVRQALRAAMRMEEGWGPSTGLRQMFLDATGAPDCDHVLHRFYTPEWPRDRVAALASRVDALAVEGDPLAIEILNAAAMQLAMFASSVRAQLWRPGEPVDIAYSGGVFESRRLLERFRIIVDLEPANSAAPPKHTPAEGALLQAYRAGGLNEVRLGRELPRSI